MKLGPVKEIITVRTGSSILDARDGEYHAKLIIRDNPGVRYTGFFWKADPHPMAMGSFIQFEKDVPVDPPKIEYEQVTRSKVETKKVVVEKVKDKNDARLKAWEWMRQNPGWTFTKEWEPFYNITTWDTT